MDRCTRAKCGIIQYLSLMRLLFAMVLLSLVCPCDLHPAALSGKARLGYRTKRCAVQEWCGQLAWVMLARAFAVRHRRMAIGALALSGWTRKYVCRGKGPANVTNGVKLKVNPAAVARLAVRRLRAPACAMRQTASA